jgi:hypothetical protein
MKTLAELQAFYESDLRPELQDMESLRLKKRKKIRILEYIMKPLIFAPAGLIVIGNMTGEDIFDAIIFQFFYMIFILVIMILIRTNIYNSYKPPEFKTLIIERIVKFIDPKLTYEPKKHISIDDYLKSRVFYFGKNTCYSGDDLVTGSIGKTNFAFSEIHSYDIIRDSKGNERIYYIFHGLLFFANFNKNFKGMTFISPRKKIMKFGKMRVNYLQSRMRKSDGELVKLEDPRFEKEFVVYSNDQIEARYILSTALMKRICDYREKTGKYIHISFVDDRVHVAIAYPHSLFEVDVYTPLDFGLIQEYYEDMLHPIGIVEDLNLNIRIWG